MSAEGLTHDAVAGSDGSSARMLHHGSSSLHEELNDLADLIGRKWNLVIISRLLHGGPMGFSEIDDEIQGISNKVLSESLKRLEDHGVVDRAIVSERPFRVEYSLTQQGAAFESIITRVREGEFRLDSASA